MHESFTEELITARFTFRPDRAAEFLDEPGRLVTQMDFETVDEVMEVVLGLRKLAKENKDWTAADLIRDELAKLDITVTDSKDGATWSKK